MWSILLLVPCLQCAVLAQSGIPETGFSDQYKSENTLGEYAFGYNEDHTSGGSFRRETGDRSGNKIGSYGLRDGDGRVRIVNYVADRNGFRADVFSNEPGLHSPGWQNPFSKINKVDTHKVDILVPGFRYSSTAPHLTFQRDDRQPGISSTVQEHPYSEELGEERYEEAISQEEDVPEDFDETSYPERHLDSHPDTFAGMDPLSQEEYGHEESTNIDQNQTLDISDHDVREISSQIVEDATSVDSLAKQERGSDRNRSVRYHESSSAGEDLSQTSQNVMVATKEDEEPVITSESRMNETLSRIGANKNETTTKAEEV